MGLPWQTLKVSQDGQQWMNIITASYWSCYDKKNLYLKWALAEWFPATKEEKQQALQGVTM